jgi:hypothetical protein
MPYALCPMPYAFPALRITALTPYSRRTLVGERGIGWRNSDVNPYTAPQAFLRGLFAQQSHWRWAILEIQL